jgi:hypothetical protein
MPRGRPKKKSDAGWTITGIPGDPDRVLYDENRIPLGISSEGIFYQGQRGFSSEELRRLADLMDGKKGASGVEAQ